jgi:hypothetical protein
VELFHPRRGKVAETEEHGSLIYKENQSILRWYMDSVCRQGWTFLHSSTPQQRAKKTITNKPDQEAKRHEHEQARAARSRYWSLNRQTFLDARRRR